MPGLYTHHLQFGRDLHGVATVNGAFPLLTLFTEFRNDRALSCSSRAPSALNGAQCLYLETPDYVTGKTGAADDHEIVMSSSRAGSSPCLCDLLTQSRFHSPIFNGSTGGCISPQAKLWAIFQDPNPQPSIPPVTLQPPIPPVTLQLSEDPVHTLGHCGHWLCDCFPH